MTTNDDTYWMIVEIHENTNINCYLGGFMRIRVAIIEQDTGYLEKITNVFNTRYTEQVEIHAFTVMNRAIEFLQSNRVDMILVDEQIEMQLKMFPSKCNLAYLVDSMGIEV